MTWLLEEPIYIIILGVVLLLFLGFALFQSGYRPLLHAMLAVVALTAGLLLLEHLVQTDKEKVVAALHAIARDVEANDREAVYAHVYSGAPETLADAQREFPQYTFHKVKITDNVKMQLDDGPPRRADVSFNVVVDVEYQGYRERRVVRYVEVTLVFEDEQWRVASYRHEAPRVFGGQD